MDMNSLGEVQKIYNDVAEWLKFAEAKHAGLFAIWLATLIGFVSADFFSDLNMAIQVVVFIVILLGSSINLLSFIPFLNRNKWLKSKCYEKYSSVGENCVFYQSIFVKTYKDNINDSIQEYKKILRRRGFTVNDELTNDYIRQVIEVSTVGTIKVYLFSWAVKYTVAVMLMAIVGLVIA